MSYQINKTNIKFKRFANYCRISRTMDDKQSYHVSNSEQTKRSLLLTNVISVRRYVLEYLEPFQREPNTLPL